MSIGLEHVPTALETEKCPPHRWYLTSANLARCLKCGAVKGFQEPVDYHRIRGTSHSASSRGGMKRKGKKKGGNS